MAVRTLAQTGIAFAVAGMIAVTPVIAPPLTPNDLKVVADSKVQLAANDFQTLVNTFFGEYPGDPDAPGTIGAPGVLNQLLQSIAGSGDGATLVNTFFSAGITPIIEQLLLDSSPDPVQHALLQSFFAGGATEVAHLLTLANTSDPSLVPYINAFFDQTNENPALVGLPGVIYLRLMAAGLAPEQQAVVNDFFQGGATQVVWNQLLARTNDPQQVQTINDFFTGGATQVVRTQLLSATTDPNQLADIAAFFPDAYTEYEGGISENIRLRLLAANSDPTQQALINGFFDTGISEVVRYLLAGPAPTPPANTLARTFKVADVQEDPAPVDPTPVDTELNAAAANLKPVDSDPAPVIEKKVKLATEPVQAVQPVAAAAPVAPAVASPPPVQASAPAAPVVVKTVDEDDTEDSNDVTDAMKTGNKVVVDPILITGANGRGPKAGEGSWGVFGQVADAIGKTIAGASAPKTSTGSTGAADGS
jgi:hypothetical protein